MKWLGQEAWMEERTRRFARKIDLTKIRERRMKWIEGNGETAFSLSQELKTSRPSTRYFSFHHHHHHHHPLFHLLSPHLSWKINYTYIALWWTRLRKRTDGEESNEKSRDGLWSPKKLTSTDAVPFSLIRSHSVFRSLSLSFERQTSLHVFNDYN